MIIRDSNVLAQLTINTFKYYYNSNKIVLHLLAEININNLVSKLQTFILYPLKTASNVILYNHLLQSNN